MPANGPDGAAAPSRDAGGTKDLVAAPGQGSWWAVPTLYFVLIFGTRNSKLIKAGVRRRPSTREVAKNGVDDGFEIRADNALALNPLQERQGQNGQRAGMQ